MVYRVSQAILCICWFIFSIVGGNSPFDGWTKFKPLSECNLGFSIFLGVMQNLIYFTVCGMGIYNIVMIGRLYGEDPFINEQPVGSNEHTNEGDHQENDGGFVGGMIKKFGARAQRDKQDDEV